MSAECIHDRYEADGCVDCLRAEVARLTENERIDRRNIISLSESEQELTAEVERLKAERRDLGELVTDLSENHATQVKATAAIEAELAAERERHHATAGRVERLTLAGSAVVAAFAGDAEVGLDAAEMLALGVLTRELETTP